MQRAGSAKASIAVRLSRSQKQPSRAKIGRMDKTIRLYSDFQEMKADEYRYWQNRPVHERVAAVSELTQEQYALKGAAADVPRLQRTLIRFERAPR
jgi:hypothetical protein